MSVLVRSALAPDLGPLGVKRRLAEVGKIAAGANVAAGRPVAGVGSWIWCSGKSEGPTKPWRVLLTRGRLMTEAEWQACADPDAMRSFGWDKLSNRKQRLFCCACCRRCYSVAPDVVRNVIDLAERYADKSYTGEPIAGGDMKQAMMTTTRSFTSVASIRSIYALFAAQDALQRRMTGGAAMWAARAVATDPDASSDDATAVAERVAQSNLLRDIFGNPFCPVAFDPSWLTSDVLALATGIYAEKAFDRLPILADALMDAGCSQEELLNHLRSDGPHVKGCWALDLVLGKS